MMVIIVCLRLISVDGFNIHVSCFILNKVTLTGKETAVDGITPLLSHTKDAVRIAAAHAMSSVAIHLQDDENNGAADGGGGGVNLSRLIVSPLLSLMSEGSDQWQLKHGVSRALAQCCIKVNKGESAQALTSNYLEIMTSMQSMIKEGLNKNAYLQIYGCEALGLVCKAVRKNELSTSVVNGLHTFVLKGDILPTLIEVHKER
jgi:hypothetical protein